MSLNLANMLQTSIQFRNQFNYDHQVAVRPEEGLRMDYVSLNVALTELASSMGWYRLGESVPEVDQATLLKQYIDVLNHVFWVAARQTWSHLIVLDDEKLKALVAKRPAKSLSQQFLTTQHFLDQSLFERQQAAFEHAWHLILKLGLVDLQFDQDQIEATYLTTFKPKA